MAIKKFGQDVYLTVEDAGGALVLDASGLRVDFDIRLIDGFNLATFTIYNLDNASVGEVMATGSDGERYVTLGVSLHGSPVETLATRYYVSNAVDEIKVPNRIVKLYCYDQLRKNFLEKTTEFTTKAKNLKGLVGSITTHVGFNGSVDYSTFPDNLEDKVLSKRPSRTFTGNMQQCMSELGKEFEFNMYTKDGNLLLLYKPNLNNVKHTSLSSDPTIRLQTNNMRSNPSIGIGNLTVVSNLDPRIGPGSILDIGDLVTLAAEDKEQNLQVVEDLLASVTGYSRYQSFSVQHKGSNYTGDWHTIVNALSPTEGKLMPTGSTTWFRP